MQFLPSTGKPTASTATATGSRTPTTPGTRSSPPRACCATPARRGNWHDAIFSYNHAEWYVEDVLADAAKWSALGSSEAGTSCEAAPPNERVARMVAEADRLSAMRPETEYVWGGSHGISPTPPNGPFDCSSAVSHLLQVGGFRQPDDDDAASQAGASRGRGAG